MRSLAREKVFEYLFSRLFNPTDEGLFSVLIKELSEEDKAFAQKVLNKVLDNEPIYNEKLSEIVENFKFSRILNADKCALFIGMAELDLKEVPIAVAIDEAVKISSKYSTEKSTDFVNGILAEYNREKNNA